MFSGFDPDPDISDPEDPYFGTGTWHYADGGSAYGQGDPEEAMALYKPPAPVDGSPPQAEQFGPPEAPQSNDGVPPMIARPPESDVNIPKSARIAYVHNNPGNLKYAGQEGAERGEPAEDGGHWAAFRTPEEGVAALNRQIELDATRGKTVAEFISKYAPPSSNDTEKYIRDASSSLGAEPSSKLSDLDRSKVLDFMMKAESGSTRGGGSQPLQPQAMPATQSAQPRGVPGGLIPSGVEIKGQQKTAEQVQQAQRGVYDQTMQQVAAVQNAAQQRQAGRDEAVKIIADQSNRFKADQQAQLDLAIRTKAEANDNVAKAMATQLDPGRVIKNMSTGDVVLGVLALALGGLGQTLQQRGGQRNATNGGLDAMTKAIDDDVEEQKKDKQSRVAHWTKIFNDSDMGIKAARAEMFNAAGKLAEFKATTAAANADIAAQMMQDSAALMAKGQQEAQGLVDRENERLTIRYAPPEIPKGRAPGSLGEPVPLGLPKIARVGLEDRDEETRHALANAYNPDSRVDVGQMNGLTKEMGEVSKLEKTLDALNQWYGVDDKGKLITDTTATGPWWNLKDSLGPDDERDRAIKDLWSAVELDTRSGWKTEPNGEVKQVELSGVNKPKRDEETPSKLADLKEEIRRRKEAIMSGTSAPVRAAYKYQNGYPFEGSGSGRPVTGKVNR